LPILPIPKQYCNINNPAYKGYASYIASGALSANGVMGYVNRLLGLLFLFLLL